MEYLLDTTTISYMLEKERRVSRRFNRLLVSDQAYTSVISEAELIYGALRLQGARGRNLHDEITDLLDRLSLKQGALLLASGRTATSDVEQRDRITLDQTLFGCLDQRGESYPGGHIDVDAFTFP